MKTVLDVVRQAVTDPIFSAELQCKAHQVAQKGRDSTEYKELLFYFATTPEELASLAGPGDGSRVPAARPTTITTFTTVTSVPCFTTTTTTTTTDF